jgi:hypothetical protein
LVKGRLYRSLSTRYRYLRASGRLRRQVQYSIVGLLALGAVWVFITALVARQQAQHFASTLQRVRALVSAGQLDQARTLAHELPAMAHRAHRLTTGPAWWTAAQVPYLGDPVDVFRGFAAAGDQFGSEGIPALLDAATKVDPRTVRTKGDTIDLAALKSAQPDLQAGRSTLNSTVGKIAKLPKHTWLRVVDNERASLAGELNAVDGYVDAAARAAQIMPGMFGDGGLKRYFVGLQNESELRGTGGLPGAFAIVECRNGKVKFTHFESDAKLLRVAGSPYINTGLHFGAAFDDTYETTDPTTLYINSNISPNFPYAAQTWARMWEKVSGEHIDGSLAIDPTALSYVLSATGPVRVEGTVVTAANIVALTERDAYAIYPDNDQRKAFLVAVLKATSTKLTSGAGDALQVARLLSVAARQQRLLVWSTDTSAQAALLQTSYGGAVPKTDRPLAALVLNNAAGGKLDYYLARTLTYHRSGCGTTRDVLVTITLANNAPASGLPKIVIERLDRNPPRDAQEGDNRALLDYYATSGALLESATVNDKPVAVSVKQDLGHPIFRLDLELPRATTQTVVLHLTEPEGHGSPIIWRQPGVQPLVVNAYSQACD